MSDELPVVSAALEYGFHNITFSDVLKRMEHGLASIEALHALLKTRAAAEERYAKALRSVPDAMTSTGPLANLFKAKTQVKSDLGTFHAALSCTKQQIALNAAKRAVFGNLLLKLASNMEALKSTFTSHWKKAMAQVAEATDRLKKLEKQLSKAESNHEKAISDHRSAVMRYQDVHEDPGDFSESEKRKRFNAQVSASDNLRASVEKLQQAKEWVQAGRAHRVSLLADVAQHLERVELYRLQQVCFALRDLNEAEKGVLSAQVLQHRSISEVVETANAEADLRMFIHKSRTNSMVTIHETELREDLLRFQRVASAAEELFARRRLAAERKQESADNKAKTVPVEGEDKDSGGVDRSSSGNDRSTTRSPSDASDAAEKGSGQAVQDRSAPATPPRILIRAAEDIGIPQVSPSILRSDGWGFGSKEYAKSLINKSLEKKGALDPASLHDRLEDVSTSDDVIPVPISEEERRFSGPDTEKAMAEVEESLSQWVDWLFSDTSPDARAQQAGTSTPAGNAAMGSRTAASRNAPGTTKEPDREDTHLHDKGGPQTPADDKEDKEEEDPRPANDPASIVSSDSVVQPPETDLHDLISTRAGVNVFAKLLNSQRGRWQELSATKFSVLAAAMRECLDVAEREGDVYAAKILMILGDTFYKKPANHSSAGGGSGESPESEQKEGEGNIFIRTCIEDHSLWQVEAYWEEAFYRSVRDEVAKMNRRQRLAIIRATDTSTEMTSTDVDITQGTPVASAATEDGKEEGAATSVENIDWRGRRRAVDGVTRMWPGTKEWDYTYTNMVFGQLGSYTMNMRSFGLSIPAVRRIVRRLALGHGLPKAMLEALLQTVDTTATTSQSEQEKLSSLEPL